MMRRGIHPVSLVIKKLPETALARSGRNRSIMPTDVQAAGMNLVSRLQIKLLRLRLSLNMGQVRSWQRFAVLSACAAVAACSGSDVGNNNGGTPKTAASAAGPITPANVPTTSKGYPRRADGWWQIKRLDSAGAAAGSQYVCVGQGSEETLSVYDQIVPFENCSKKEFERTATGWAFDTVCKEMDTTMASKGTIAGDFEKRLRVDLVVTNSDGSTMSGSVVGNREGDCPAGVRGGSLANDKGEVIGNVTPQ